MTSQEPKRDALRQTMRQVYLACSSGGKPPAAYVTSGTVLNRQTGHKTYDPRKVYTVSADGIHELRDAT